MCWEKKKKEKRKPLLSVLTSSVWLGFCKHLLSLDSLCFVKLLHSRNCMHEQVCFFTCAHFIWILISADLWFGNRRRNCYDNKNCFHSHSAKVTGWWTRGLMPSSLQSPLCWYDLLYHIFQWLKLKLNTVLRQPRHGFLSPCLSFPLKFHFNVDWICHLTASSCESQCRSKIPFNPMNILYVEFMIASKSLITGKFRLSVTHSQQVQYLSLLNKVYVIL